MYFYVVLHVYCFLCDFLMGFLTDTNLHKLMLVKFYFSQLLLISKKMAEVNTA